MAEFIFDKSKYDNTAVVTWLEEQECQHYALFKTLSTTTSKLSSCGRYKMRMFPKELVIVGLYDLTITIMFKLRFDVVESTSNQAY